MFTCNQSGSGLKAQETKHAFLLFAQALKRQFSTSNGFQQRSSINQTAGLKSFFLPSQEAYASDGRTQDELCGAELLGGAAGPAPNGPE